MAQNDQQQILIAWLNDAYALENQLINTLESQVKDAKDHPMVQSRIQQHLDATRRHAEMVKGCVERLGGDTSAIKTGASHLLGIVQGASTSVMGAKAHDTLVKDALADFSAENLEIASYKALIVAAQELGDQQTVQVCRQILQDEEAMAEWLNQNLPMVVRETLQQAATAS